MSPHIHIGPEPVLAAYARSPPAAGSRCPAGADSAPHSEQNFLLLARTPGVARLLQCVTELLSWACAGPLPRAWDQLDVDCVLLLGGVAGAGTGRRRMTSSLCLPAIGGRPH